MGVPLLQIIQWLQKAKFVLPKILYKIYHTKHNIKMWSCNSQRPTTYNFQRFLLVWQALHAHGKQQSFDIRCKVQWSRIHNYAPCVKYSRELSYALHCCPPPQLNQIRREVSLCQLYFIIVYCVQIKEKLILQYSSVQQIEIQLSTVQCSVVEKCRLHIVQCSRVLHSTVK